MATTQPFDNDFFAVLKDLPGVTVLSHLSLTPTAGSTRTDLSPESDDSDDEVKYTADEMNIYREIMLILESVRMEFFWNNETYLLQAALPSDWERLKLVSSSRPCPQLIRSHIMCSQPANSCSVGQWSPVLLSYPAIPIVHTHLQQGLGFPDCQTSWRAKPLPHGLQEQGSR